ncbi:YdiU family protein [Acinetobacter sp. B10A]|uniref:protein adenylyltransferase SelO n=1 Tax=Acinetobacter baretiae TaxID=2605383 RepID=UPI001B3C9336|nr:YdiU family protein [Acinetobacter baretiae]MBF7685176.1 YdiU family protein [Acinetobacter baretiae]
MLFQNRYNQLDSKLYTSQSPKPLHGAKAGHFNVALADELQWSTDEKALWVEICSGQHPLSDCSALAMVYAGHQFGHWAGQLGDGRGLLLAQVLNKKNQVIDLHLKGAGLTPYSRGGDGRAVLRSVIREYLAGHALNSLGVPSSNAVGFTSSQQGVQRETLEPGAMLLRTSDCHIRFGHFEWINQYAPELLGDFAMQCIAWHYPECLEDPQPILSFARAVVKRTAKMIADWQAVGFAHGVMNTDNLNITGSTLDFGPFGFLERFKPDWINNHSDHQGRYCYQNQPRMAHWNLSILLNNLMPLAPHTEKESFKQHMIACLADFEVTFLQHYQEKMCFKMGLPQFHKESFECTLHFLQILQREKLDYTQSFIRLQEGHFNALKDDCIDRDGFDAFMQRYQSIRIHQDQAQLNDSMQQHNPRYILRNHMAQQAIERAEHDDFSEVTRLFALLATPFTHQPAQERASDLQPPHIDATEIAISCSS